MNEFTEPEPPNLPELPSQPAQQPLQPPQPPPGFGTFENQQKNPLGVWALVLGILSILCCGLFTGVPAIFVGRASEKAQAAGLANNGTLGRVGWILGIIGTVLWLLIGLIYALALLFPALVIFGAATTY